MKKEKPIKNSGKQKMVADAIMEKVKSLAFPVIMTALIVLAVVVIINYQAPEEPKVSVRPAAYEGDDTPMVLENSKLKLVLDPLTTQLSVTVKSTGKVWYSNPLDADEDAIAMGTEKGKLKATLLMEYTNENGVEVPFDNYNYCLDKGLYEIEKGKDEISDYIKIKYSIGNIDREYIIPPACRVEKFESLVNQLDDSGKRNIKNYFSLVDVNEAKYADEKDALIEQYPVLATEPLYIFDEAACKVAMRNRLETMFEEVGYTMEDFEEDKALNIGEATTDKPVFNISVVYRLDDDTFRVEIPLKEMEARKTNPIYRVAALPYFGAGGLEDEGYLMVPEGGGAIINFNNGKTAYNAYQAEMYGWDMALVRKAVVHNSRAYFNAFGIANGEDSFICILEDGSSRATVKADISGKNHNYNFAYAAYDITEREKYDTGNLSQSDIYVFIPELPDETIVQKYVFVDSNDYVDMAKTYQKDLETKYNGYFKANDDKSAPVNVEILGAVDKVMQVMGIPTRRPLTVTTYKAAASMLEELNADGIKNMSVKLTGWCNGGVNQHLTEKVKLISDMGSKKDLQNLSDTAKNIGADLYLDGVTQYAYDSDLLDGFFAYADAARFVSKQRAKLFVYSDVTFTQRYDVDGYYLLKNSLSQNVRMTLAKAAKQYGTGVSFREDGMDLSSDFNRNAYMSREATKVQHSDNFKQMKDAGLKIITNMGNDYSAPYSDMVTNMKLRGEDYGVIDAFIPFYQIALHGKVNYTGESLNLAADGELELLLSAEYGAGLSFTLMRESSFILQKTLYTQYYGAAYDSWHDRMVEIYTKYNKELGHTFNQEIVDHEKLANGLACTTYADGTKVYVNYSYENLKTPAGVVVPARDYKAVR